MKPRLSRLFKKILCSEEIDHKVDANQLSDEERQKIKQLAELEQLIRKDTQSALSESGSARLQQKLMERICQESISKMPARLSLPSLLGQLCRPLGKVAAVAALLAACCLLVILLPSHKVEPTRVAEVTPLMPRPTLVVSDRPSASDLDPKLTTDWRYILISPRTCYFLNLPELQPGGEQREENHIQKL